MPILIYQWVMGSEERWDIPNMTPEVRPSKTIEVPDAPALPGLAFRRYRGEEDLPRFKAVFDGSKDADEVWWSHTLEEFQAEYRHLVGCDPDKDILVTEVEGDVVGYVALHRMPELDGVVTYRHHEWLLPEWRGKGIMRAMRRWSEARSRQLMEEHPGEGPNKMSQWVTEPEVHRMELLKEAGYGPARYFHEMLRDLREPIPDLPLPEGIEVRPAPPEDYRKVFDAANEALNDHWGARQWDEEEFLEWQETPLFQPELWVVGYDGDEVAGQVINWINAAENAEHDRKWGYTEIISVRRPYRGKGLAKAMVARSMVLVRDQGMEQANLGVDTENPSGAFGLYSGLGYRPIKTYMVYMKDLDVSE